MNHPYISIVIPTLNEEKNLGRLFQSFLHLHYPKNSYEVIVVDGYSTDDTRKIAKQFGAKVVFNKLRIRGAGCQVGIEESHGKYVAFTDADCTVPANWLTGLLRHFTDKRIASVGGPNVTPARDTPFAKAVGEMLTVLTKPGARYGARSGIVGKTFHNPGCNVLYKKDAIRTVGGFNTRLVTCEDEELDYRLTAAGYTHIFTPHVTVDHYRRPTFKRIFIQSYRFAVGRAQAIRLHPGMARWFHFVPSIICIGLLVCAFLAPAYGFINLIIAVLLGSSVLFAIGISMHKNYAPWHTYLVILYCWGIGWALGFIRGLFNRPHKQEPI